MTFTYWLILFVTACFANVVGLNISDGLKSVVAIYVIVPFLLVPQILLAGVIVKFDKLHYHVASHEVVPVIGDLMASRWAYEALVVGQYVNNDYQQNFYDIEMQESNIIYDRQFLIPSLVQEIEDVKVRYNRDPSFQELESNLGTIQVGFNSIILTGTYPGTDRFTLEDFSESLADSAVDWLQDYQSRLLISYRKIEGAKDDLVRELRDELGGTPGFLQFKRKYYNESLADLVLNRVDLHKIVKINHKLIRKMEPVYMYPVRKNGRAQFYASVKRVGGRYLPAVLFNVLALTLMISIFYLALQYRILRKTLDFLGTKRRKSR